MNRHKERGFVLLITLFVVSLLTIIIFEIYSQSRADLRAAENFRDDLAAYYLALSGITGEKEILKDDLKNGQLDYSGELWAAAAPPVPIGEGTVSGKITDESGKFNLNSLLDANDHPILFKKNQLGNLFRLLSVDPFLVDPIIDWVDKNEQTEPNGAEDETYQVRKPPYPTKNGRLDTIEEMLYIDGITPEVYQTISPYLTISTNGMINVNTADSIILQSIDPIIDESIAKQLMEGIPYNNAQDFFTALPAGNYKNGMNFSTLFTVGSSVFSIQSTGTVRDTDKSIHAIWDRAQKKYLYFKVE